MVQFVKDVGYAEKLGTGLGEALKYLAANRLDRIHQQEYNQRQLEQQQQQTQQSYMQKAQGLQTLLGLSPEQSQQAAYAPESVLATFSKQRLAEPQQQAYMQALQSILGEQAPQETNAPVQQQATLPTGGLNAQQATKLAELGIKKKQFETAEKSRQQRHIETINKPILDKIEEKAGPARQVSKLADDLLGLLNTNKVITGLKGRFTPKELQTEEGQQFLSKINQLVLQKAQLGKGVPTKLRLSLEQLSKPDVWQQPKAIKKLLEDIKSEPETQKDIANDIARTQILEEHGENQPKNIRSLIEKRSKEIIEKNKKPEQNVFETLPPAINFEGKIARNPATGQRMKSINGQWVPADQGV